MRDDLIGGLRNALERGSTLEQAIQSFINAGYNSEEVHAAAALLSGGVSRIIYSDSRSEHRIPTKALSQTSAESGKKIQSAQAVQQMKQVPKPTSAQKNTQQKPAHSQAQTTAQHPLPPAPKKTNAPQAQQTNNSIFTTPPKKQELASESKASHGSSSRKVILGISLAVSVLVLLGSIGFLLYLILTR
ncbi:hypothetical protein D6817_01610 [Candidatus Pacearchaeota archaeon]|nr:MAG: hypothetical protein D6817_01610 [Candidatus Pacearchaeota archaeon]